MSDDEKEKDELEVFSGAGQPPPRDDIPPPPPPPVQTAGGFKQVEPGLFVLTTQRVCKVERIDIEHDHGAMVQNYFRTRVGVDENGQRELQPEYLMISPEPFAAETLNGTKPNVTLGIGCEVTIRGEGIKRVSARLVYLLNGP